MAYTRSQLLLVLEKRGLISFLELISWQRTTVTSQSPKGVPKYLIPGVALQLTNTSVCGGSCMCLATFSLAELALILVDSRRHYPGEREDLAAAIYEYKDVFSSGPADMGRTDLVTHSIDTGEHRPM